MNVSVQLARSSGLRVRINRKVATTAADSNEQGDVQAMEFGIPGYNDLVWDVSLVSYRIGSSTQHGLNGKLQLGVHPELLRLLWVLADMQTVKYFNLVGDEEDIRNE